MSDEQEILEYFILGAEIVNIIHRVSSDHKRLHTWVY